MIHKVVADDRLDAEAFALAERLAAGPSVALGLMRRALHAGFDSDYATALAREADDQRAARATQDGEEGGRAFSRSVHRDSRDADPCTGMIISL